MNYFPNNISERCNYFFCFLCLIVTEFPITENQICANPAGYFARSWITSQSVSHVPLKMKIRLDSLTLRTWIKHCYNCVLNLQDPDQYRVCKKKTKFKTIFFNARPRPKPPSKTNTKHNTDYPKPKPIPGLGFIYRISCKITTKNAEPTNRLLTMRLRDPCFKIKTHYARSRPKLTM